jgi:uncharacterized protein (DUF427 family)
MNETVVTPHHRSPGFAKNPSYRIRFEPTDRRVRVTVNGETIADTTRARLLLETKHLPVYYFPREDVRADLLVRTEHRTHCPYKGDASYWTLSSGSDRRENAVWSYERPYEEVAEIRDYLAFYWDRVDHWYEEDEEIVGHPRDPYHRIDVRPSSRHVRVVLGGETVADTRRALFLFETGLPTRHYIPREDVRTDLLERSATTSVCAYKGHAIYWSARVGGKLREDVVWSYPYPLPEMPRIKDLLCFFGERVDEVFVEGEAVPKVKTSWSRE